MKRERQTRILELIETMEIETQDELVEVLRSEGFNVTQATVSRDINELQLGKLPCGNGRKKIGIQPAGNQHLTNKYIRVLRDGFMSMDSAQNILVVRTVSGMAMAVAASLDALRMKEVVGSIAGDDTIMMAIRSTEETQKVMDKIREYL
ncbi:MAG: arginine repressor [Lachnospiraceae bacterium]|nr:arginine repressor [Lachnospiraceae bacterium]